MPASDTLTWFHPDPPPDPSTVVWSGGPLFTVEHPKIYPTGETTRAEGRITNLKILRVIAALQPTQWVSIATVAARAGLAPLLCQEKLRTFARHGLARRRLEYRPGRPRQAMYAKRLGKAAA